MFSDEYKAALLVQTNIEELEKSLLLLNQTVKIPDISMTVHQTVDAVIKKCIKEGRKPKVSDFGDKMRDVIFLNNLQSGVNHWIRKIQKVLQLRALAHPLGIRAH